MWLPGGLSPELIASLDGAGPYGNGWPAPRVVLGPVRIIKADVVGADHIRAIAKGDDGASIKVMAFRQAETPLGAFLLGCEKGQRCWLAGRPKIDDWGARPAAELHVEDIADA